MGLHKTDQIGEGKMRELLQFLANIQNTRYDENNNCDENNKYHYTAPRDPFFSRDMGIV